MSTTDMATIAPAGTWTLDPVHSSVGFEIPYLTGRFRGQFREFEGRLVAGEGRADINGTAKVASIDVRDENLAAHLQSPDFFDAERHPELHFQAADVVLQGDQVDVTGDITIKGETRTVVVRGSRAEPMTDAFGNERVGLELTATVDRREFGITWNMPLPTGGEALSNDVTIVADLTFVKA